MSWIKVQTVNPADGEPVPWITAINLDHVSAITLVPARGNRVAHARIYETGLEESWWAVSLATWEWLDGKLDWL